MTKSASYVGARAEPLSWDELLRIFDELFGAEARDLRRWPKVMRNIHASWTDEHGLRHEAESLEEVRDAYAEETTAMVQFSDFSTGFRGEFAYAPGGPRPRARADLAGTPDDVERRLALVRELFPQQESSTSENPRTSDRTFMERAVTQARMSLSEDNEPRPKVGAVVVRGGEILGEAFRGELRPGEHAEYTLLEGKLRDVPLAGATLYATLEPCTTRHSPKIPCADRIVARRITRVVIGTLDPNPVIRGVGIRRLRASGIQVALFDPDLMSEIEELNRDFERLHEGSDVERSGAQVAEPPLDEVGPNGHRVQYNAEGDKVELIPDEEKPGETWELILRRNDLAIIDSVNEYRDIVWWHRHQDWRERVESNLVQLTSERRSLYESANAAATEIEDRIGLDRIHELASIAPGRLSALAWVLGAEWTESLDT